MGRTRARPLARAESPSALGGGVRRRPTGARPRGAWAREGRRGTGNAGGGFGGPGRSPAGGPWDRDRATQWLRRGTRRRRPPLAAQRPTPDRGANRPCEATREGHAPGIWQRLDKGAPGPGLAPRGGSTGRASGATARTAAGLAKGPDSAVPRRRRGRPSVDSPGPSSLRRLPLDRAGDGPWATGRRARAHAAPTPQCPSAGAPVPSAAEGSSG